MRNRVWCVALLSVLALGAAPRPEPPEVLVPGLDAELAQAVLRGDIAALERLFGDDFLVTHPMGGINERAAVLDLVRKGQIRYTSYEQKVESIRVWSDVAVTVGSETVVPDVVGRPDRGQTVPRRYTHIWRRGPGGWRLKVRHASLVPPAPAPSPAR
jgi:ketosteroid isomerase-like protein